MKYLRCHLQSQAYYSSEAFQPPLQVFVTCDSSHTSLSPHQDLYELLGHSYLSAHIPPTPKATQP